MDPDLAWERVGSLDPYFGVLSHEDFRADRLSPATLERFWATGTTHVEGVLSDLEQTFGPLAHTRSAVDFGCGVGRLLRAMAPHFDVVHGIDVSSTMLSEAAKNTEGAGLPNVRLHLSDAALTGVPGDIGLIHSVLVFQHIPPARGLVLLHALADRLGADGVGYIQVSLAVSGGPLRRAARKATARSALLRRVARLVRPVASPAAGFIQMYDYDLAEVLLTLRRAGVPRVIVRVQPRDDGGRDAILMFKKPAAS